MFSRFREDSTKPGASCTSNQLVILGTQFYGRYYPVLRALHCTRSTNSQMMLMICFQQQKGSSIVEAEKKNDQNWSYSKCHAKDAAVAVYASACCNIILSPNEYNNLER